MFQAHECQTHTGRCQLHFMTPVLECTVPFSVERENTMPLHRIMKVAQASRKLLR